MTISAINSSNSFTGNGATKTFAYTFAALADSEVAVKVAGAVVSTSLYSIIRNLTDNQGGTITFLTAPANAAAIVIYSNPSFQQGADADNAGAFNLASLEEAFDRAAVRDIYIKGVIEGGELVGATGATGPAGTPGAAATINVGTVTGLASGASPTVTNTGTSTAAVFAFGIPAGAAGTAGSTPNVTIGTVSTLSTGSSATASITGTTPNLVLNLGLPTGATGSGSTVAWGGISGTLSSQTDLNTALGLKATIASPTFTGTPAGPTAAANTNTTQLATTAFVIGQAYSPIASPTFTGIPAAPTASAGTSTTQLATTAFVTTGLALKADLASPALTGTPLAPTAASATNTTQIATTAYVKSQSYATLAAPALTGAATIDGETIGYRHLPIVTKSASFTFALADDAKGHNYTGGAGTATIDPVGTTAYVVGTIYSGFNSGTANLTLTRGAGVTFYKNGSTTSADVIVGPKGRFTLVNWMTNVWTVDGTNLT